MLLISERQFIWSVIADTAAKRAIVPGRLTVRADRGSSIPSPPVTLLLANLALPGATPGPTP